MSHPDGDAAISPQVRRVRHPLQVRAESHTAQAVREMLVGQSGPHLF
ncbi:hypothetical protein [uncultured Azohydromonas sp.]|jgi:hypothetical protein|nr:hypothetical protein [uncultured Azohydromonas sp.]